MTNEEKAEQLIRLTHSYEEGTPYIHTDRVLYENLIEMAAWKDKQFSDRVEMTLCIDCHEFESCENCPKYQIKKELLGL